MAQGFTPLLMAIALGSHHILRLFLESKRVDKEYESTKGQLTRETPVSAAIHAGNETALNLLAAYGVDIAKPNSKGLLPLQIAKDENKPKMQTIIEAFIAFRDLTKKINEIKQDNVGICQTLESIKKDKSITVPERLKQLETAYATYLKETPSSMPRYQK